VKSFLSGSTSRESSVSTAKSTCIRSALRFVPRHGLRFHVHAPLGLHHRVLQGQGTRERKQACHCSARFDAD
jgi:hypothetical protein